MCSCSVSMLCAVCAACVCCSCSVGLTLDLHLLCAAVLSLTHHPVIRPLGQKSEGSKGLISLFSFFCWGHPVEGGVVWFKLLRPGGSTGWFRGLPFIFNREKSYVRSILFFIICCWLLVVAPLKLL